MRLRALSCLLLLAIAFDAAASNLYTEINRLRAGDGNCAFAGRLPALKPQPALERVARDVSRGDKLGQSLKEVGYQASSASAFSIARDSIGARAAGMLPKQGSCRELQHAAMTEVGTYSDARQVWIVLAAPLAVPLAPSVVAPRQEAAQRILDLTNQARARPRYCGTTAFNATRPLRWNDLLAEAAQLHAEDMARYGYFDHRGRDGSKSRDRIKRTGYRSHDSGENIAAGQRDAEETMAAWLGSEGHCANLMEPAFSEMGAAVAVNSRSDLGLYWVQDFGAPR